MNSNIYNDNNPRYKSIIDAIKYNGNFYIVYFIVFLIIGNFTNNALLWGTRGNGKSTLLKCIMGIIAPSAGQIVYTVDGATVDLIGKKPEEIVDLGIALVPEGRRLFPSLSVEENLVLGAFRATARSKITQNPLWQNTQKNFCKALPQSQNSIIIWK